METIPEMRARHQREKYNLVAQLAEDYSVIQAAKILNTETSTLRTYAWQQSINFKKAIYGEGRK